MANVNQNIDIQERLKKAADLIVKNFGVTVEEWKKLERKMREGLKKYHNEEGQK